MCEVNTSASAGAGVQHRVVFVCASSSCPCAVCVFPSSTSEISNKHIALLVVVLFQNSL